MSQTVVIDVDGVMTDGTFWYTEHGKVMKRFGPHDADALKILREHYEIQFITADRRGLKITQRRIVHDMGYRLDLVDELDRSAYIRHQFSNQCVFIADGLHDATSLRESTYGIAPKNAHPYALRAANHVLRRGGGHGAVAEACDHLMIKFHFHNLLGQEVPL